MNDLNAVLEIVISLAALFWLLSMICSFAVEAINSLVRNVRAEALERFICEMVLGDGSVRSMFAAWKGKLSKLPQADPLGLLSHGLTESLRKPDKWGAGGVATAPSYLPAEVFAKVLLDRLTGLAAAAGSGLGDCSALLAALGGPESPLDPAWQARFAEAAASLSRAEGLVLASDGIVSELLLQPLPAAAAQIGALRGQINAAAAALPNPAAVAHLVRLLTAFERELGALALAPGNAGLTVGQFFKTRKIAWMRLMASAGANAAGVNVVDAVRSIVEHAPLPRSLREALRPLLAHAQFDLEMLRKGIEGWYDSVMDRATGWFKRHTTMMLGGLGLLLAVVLNINPILIWQDLTKDPALRSAGVAFANQVIEQQGDSTLARKIVFSREAKSKDWAAQLSQLERFERFESAAPSKQKEAVDALARKLQPLLLRSGEFAGLLPEIQPLTRDDGSARSGVIDRRRFVEAVCAAWHDAQVSAGRVRKDEKPFAGLQSCPVVVEHFDRAGVVVEKVEVQTITTPEPSDTGSSTTTSTKRTRYLDPGAVAGAAGALSDTDIAKFWSSGEIVWDTRLAAALWEAQVGIRKDPAQWSATYKALKEAFDTTRAQSDEANERLASFLDRLPSVGWQWDPDKSKSCGEKLKALWPRIWPGIFGWPLTALMVSFGAAFWFDLLSKLMNRRVTGPVPVPSTP